MDIVSVYAWLQVRLSVGSDSREGNITASAQDSCTLRSVLLFACRLCTSAGQSATGTVCLSVCLSQVSVLIGTVCLSVCLSQVSHTVSHWPYVCLSQVGVVVILSVIGTVRVLVKTAVSRYLSADLALSVVVSYCLYHDYYYHLPQHLVFWFY